MRRAFLLLLIAALGVGCVQPFERPALQKTRFVLAAAPAAERSAPVAGPLWLGRVRVSALFDGKGFVYRTGESTFESDFFHEFFAPPGEVLRDAMREWFSAGSAFASIESSGRSDPEWLLETDVEELYADLRDPSGPHVVLAARFHLLDLRRARPVRVLDLRLAESEPAADRSPQALVDAWNRALARQLVALDAELHTVTRARVGTATR